MNDNEISIENPDKGTRPREFKDGSSRNVADLPSIYIGKGTYKPGWCWSKHAGVQTGKQSARHIGYVISGEMVVKSPAGLEKIVRPGEAFEMGPDHDAWVKGEESCEALDFEAKYPTLSSTKN